jgi:D-alanyl-D-alanine dipeptidase
VRTMHARGQSVDIAFCGDEPLDLELRAEGRSDLQQSGVRFHELPCRSHTLKPLAAQQAAHAILDEIVERRLLGSAAAAHPSGRAGPRLDRAKLG